jgi:hypothetical protein
VIELYFALHPLHSYLSVKATLTTIQAVNKQPMMMIMMASPPPPMKAAWKQRGHTSLRILSSPLRFLSSVSSSPPAPCLPRSYVSSTDSCMRARPANWCAAHCVRQMAVVLTANASCHGTPLQTILATATSLRQHQRCSQLQGSATLLSWVMSVGRPSSTCQWDSYS